MEYHSSGSLPLLGRPRYCPGANANTANGNGARAGGANANGGYLCETGHCCGESGCCTYYYELWWFWLLWSGLILFSCCCAYRHRRAKLRVQQQQRQTDISLLAYHGAAAYPASMLDLSFLASLKLPSYEEIAAQPSTPPPPYSSVYTTSPRYAQPPAAPDPHLLTHHQPPLHRPCTDMLSSLSSDNSSSCSCDSCCPSSPCSSSLSVAVTYETDTSHASTPCGVPPLPLHVTVETVATEAGLEAVVLTGAVAVATPVGGDENDVIAACSLVDGPQVAAETAGRSDHAPCSEGLPAQSPDHTPKHTPSPDSNHTHNIGYALNLNHGPTLNTTPDLSPTPNLDPAPIVSPSSDPSPSPDKSPTPHASPAPGHGEGLSSDSAPVSRSCKTSLSPSPRPSPSPPKQTLFSPCVDVYEAGPPSWGAGPGGEVGEEGDDVGADESQYRQRRLTGDSGIEVCRCRMEEEEEEEEEEEVEGGRGGGGGGGGGKDSQKNGGEGGRGGSDVSALHDSDDCPARALGAATPCSPASNPNPVAAATPTPTPLKEPGEVIVVVETV